MRRSRGSHYAAGVVLVTILATGCGRSVPEKTVRDTAAVNIAPVTDIRKVASKSGDGVLHAVHPGEVPNAQVGELHVGPPHDTATAEHSSWTLAGVLERLQANGVKAAVAGPVRQPFMGPAGTRIRMNGGEIQVYLYSDQNVRARETDLLDPIRVTPVGTTIMWRMPASLVVDNNAAFIVLTPDRSLRSRVTAAITGNHS
ncbi:MAG: hypothetical protein ABIS03_04675 [Gemmatimonadaceae bacterium]